MFELNDLNPDVMRAELAYRRERLSAAHRVPTNGRGRWLRTRRRPVQADNTSRNS